MKSINMSACTLSATILLAACNLPGSQTSTQTGLTQSWIDAPLNGSVLPLAPVVVVSHSSDLGGINQIELSVDGALINTIASPDASKTIVNVSQTWNPLGPGEYTLQVRAQNTAGSWGDYAMVVITILGGLTETPSPTATPTPALGTSLTPTYTSTPAPTITTSPTISPSATQPIVGGIRIARVSSNLLSIEGGSCGPQEVTILAEATHPEGIEVVVLFFKLTGKTDGQTTEWFSKAMSLQGGDQYAAVITVGELMSDLTDLGVVGGDQDAWLAYQAVVQTASGDTGTRTEVFSDITVTICP